MKKWFMFMVLCPLFLGAAFYYIFCPDVFFVTWIDTFTGIYAHITDIPVGNPVLGFIRSYLLDFVWAFAFAAMIYLLTYKEKKLRWLVLIIPVITGVIMEVLQLHGLISGTYDVFDIIIEIIGAILAFTIVLLRMGDNYEKD